MTAHPESLSVLVCRGCCCGTQDGPDHAAHLESIAAATLEAGGRLKVTNCIGPCDRKNVVVVRTRQPLSRWKAQYFSAVDDVEVDAIVAWFGAGVLQHDAPAELASVRFEWPLPRPRLARPSS